MVIALAGKPNVGKSSLFNRLVGRRKSLVWDQPGVTRDIIRGVWSPDSSTEAEIWDLAGYGNFGISFSNLTEDQISQIAVILLLVDGSEPLTQEDFECFAKIRTLQIPIIVALNKCDKTSFADNHVEIFTHFKKNILPISAEAQIGMVDLQELLFKLLSQKGALKLSAPKAVVSRETTKRVTILGRPNVGKSTLLNLAAGEQVSVVADEAGTTRDLTEFRVERRDRQWIFQDTAGVRKKSRVYGRKSTPIEIFSVGKALKSLKTSDFVLFLVEANTDALLNTQDRKLLHLVRSGLVPTLILVNKWDLVRSKWTEDKYKSELKTQLGDLAFIPILMISAQTGFHFDKIFQLLINLERSVRKIPTPKLNRWLQKVNKIKSPRVARRGKSGPRGRSATQYLKFTYMVQTDQNPMTFHAFCNAPEAVAEDDKRFLERNLRQEFRLEGVPLKLTFRKKK